MKVVVIGTRGFPHIQGGVEKHCEALYPLIAEKGWGVTVFRRRLYINQKNEQQVFRKVKFRDLWTVRNNNFEAIIHSLLASIICLCQRPDVVHIHNIGPSLVLPLLKLGGNKTVVTYHSPNYEHRKWSWFAKKMLKLGERFMATWADRVIFVSKAQEELVDCKNKTYIPNGVAIPSPSFDSDFITQIGAEPGKYVLAVSRIVPEKGLDVLIKAFQRLEGDFQLVIAGDADHETEYSRRIKRMIKDDKRIIHAGYTTGEPLNQIYTHARLFVLPSYHEGLPIALLEAMSYGLPVLVSKIPANLEVGLPAERYFQCGNTSDLQKKMEMLLDKGLTETEQRDLRLRIAEKYNWLRIADQTIEVYKRALRNEKEKGKRANDINRKSEVGGRS
jgi:glycosyltransferase involved in cell wall biosynthesis